MWEQVWGLCLEVRVFSYGVRFLFPSTTSRIIISGESASVDSQATQPHLEDSTTYHPLRPTIVYGRQNHF